MFILSKEWNKKTIWILWIVITLIQLGVNTYIFAVPKEGFHSDELWSYGFANGDHEIQIYQNEDGTVKNYAEWTDGNICRNYLEVSEEQRFDYGNVCYNMSQEMNPPLHSLILHTICSFFPNTFSWWYAYGINIVAFLITMLFLFLLTRELTRSDKVALLTCFFYGFTVGCRNDFIYLRAYAMITAAACILVYLHIRMFRKEFQNIKWELIFCFLTMVFGEFSHYYFLAFGFAIAAVFSIYTLCKKKLKFLVLYDITMLVSVGVLFACWPTARYLLKNVGNLYPAEMPLKWEINRMLILISREIVGFEISFLDRYIWSIIGVVVLFILIFGGGIGFLIRKIPKVAEFYQRVARGFVNIPRNIIHYFRDKEIFGFLIFATTVIAYIIITKLTNVFMMGNFSTRYYFLMEPIWVMLWFYAIYLIYKKIHLNLSVKKFAVFALCMIMFLLSYRKDSKVYLMGRESLKPPLSEQLKDQNVIVASASLWKMEIYSYYLRTCKQFFFTDTEDCLKDVVMDNLLKEGAFDKDQPIYIITENQAFYKEGGYGVFDGVNNFQIGENVQKQLIGTTLTLRDFLEKYVQKLDYSKAILTSQEYTFAGYISVYRLDP